MNSLLSSFGKILRNVGPKLSAGINVVAIVALILTYLSLRNSNEQLKIANQERNESKYAEIVLNYVRNVADTTATIYISNFGNQIAESVWVSEKVFLVAPDGIVYEGDLPRYSYISYRGSKRKMFHIAPKSDTSFNFWPACFIDYRRKLFEKFSGQLVLQWRIDFNNGDTPQRKTRFFNFLLDGLDTPHPPNEITGGYGYVQAVEEFQKFGPPRLLEFVGEFQSYFLNPPNTYYKDSLGVMHFYYPDTEVPDTAEILIEVPLDNFHIGHSGKGYQGFWWDCDPGQDMVKSAALRGIPLY